MVFREERKNPITVKLSSTCKGSIPNADEILQRISEGELIAPYPLYYGLGFDSTMTTYKFGPIVHEQYLRALQLHEKHWIKDARYYASLFFAEE